MASFSTITLEKAKCWLGHSRPVEEIEHLSTIQWGTSILRINRIVDFHYAKPGNL
jgi:hypothetical protein